MVDVQKRNEELYKVDEQPEEATEAAKDEKEVAEPPKDRGLGSVPKRAALKHIGVLGKGAYGLVTLVEDENTKITYALKAIKKRKIVDNSLEPYILTEKNIMQKLNSPFLVNLVATYMNSKQLFFLLEVCLGGDLWNILKKEKCFDEPTTRFYSACVIEAFAHMHTCSIVYRDLKPENLVLNAAGYLKITDFGFAKEISDRTYTLCGTPDYMAPEVIAGKGHSFGVDWWTLGILMFEMLSSTPPFVDHDENKKYKKILKCHVKFPRFFSKPAKTLILGLLRKKQTRRLGVKRGGPDLIRAHPFFSQAPGWSWSELQAQTMKAPLPVHVTSTKDLQNFDNDESDYSEESSDDDDSIGESDDEVFDGFDSL